MFKRFLRSRKPQENAPILRFQGGAPSPKESLTVVGDIHGQLGCLHAMIEQLNDQAPDSRGVLVGDLIDRGEQSASV